MKNSRFNIKKQGFTLIELLCVIAIIAILSSLMMPELQQIRNGAMTTQCSSNLRQIGVSVNLYLSDHSNMYPYVKPDPASGLPSPYANYPDLDAQANTMLVTFQPYGVTDKILQCQADLVSGPNSNYAKYQNSYFWNPVDDGDTGNTILVARRMGLQAAKLSRVRQAQDYAPVHRLNPQSAGKSNILYADGHVVTQ